MPTLATDTDQQRRERAYALWQEHARRWGSCQECPLCTQRTSIVLAKGSVPCDCMFLGEAPGVSEDTSGLPFDGPAGAKLDEIVAAVRASSMVQFTEAYTNLVSCFPREAKQTKDHRPEDDEIKACSPRLQEFVALCQPRLIVAVGDTADEWGPVVAGAPQEVEWCHIVHPAAILRMPAAQKDMATRKQVAILRDAIERVMTGGTPW